MFDVSCRFHLSPASLWHDAGYALDALKPYAKWLGEHDPTMKRWFLGGETLDLAKRYEVFGDELNGHTVSKAFFAEKYKNSRAPVAFLWNGDESTSTGASLVLSVTDTIYPCEISLELDGAVSKPRLGGYKETAEFVAMLAKETNALCCFVYHQAGYSESMAFIDRPGVGWMLYLPRVLTMQDVPEARALLPVMKDEKQLGTIIVSVVDEVLNHRDPDHMKVAQAIEVRLVSQDMLPTWAQMMRPR